MIEKIKYYFQNKQFIKTIDTCEQVLKKQPLSWDAKYDILIIKIECLINLARYDECENVLTTIKKIKNIFHYSYFKAIIELRKNKNLLKAEKYFNDCLNTTPFQLQEERGRVYSWLAVIKVKQMNYGKAEYYLETAREMLNDNEYKEFLVQYLISKKEYNKALYTVTLLQDENINKIWLNCVVLRKLGYYKKAYNKIKTYYEKNGSEYFIFLKELYISAFLCNDLSYAQEIKDKIIKNSEYKFPENENSLLIDLLQNRGKPVESLTFFPVRTYGSKYRCYLPSPVYTLLKKYNLTGLIKDIYAKTNLYTTRPFDISNYLNDKGINHLFFLPSKNKQKRLLKENVPFIFIKEKPENLTYELICGYNQERGDFICADNGYRYSEFPSKKEDKLSSLGMVICDKKTFKKVEKIFKNDDFNSHMKFLNRAKEFYFNQEYENSLQEINKFKQFKDDLPECIALEFSCYMNEKEFKKARELVSYCKEKKLSGKALLFEADLYLHKNKLKLAEKSFKNYLKKENSVYGLKGLAKIYLEKGDHNKALEYALEAYSLNYLNRDTIISLGIIYVYKEDLINGWQYFNTALSIHKDAVVYDHAGWAATREENWNKAKNLFEKSLGFDEENFYAYFQLGFILRKMGNSYKAISYLEKSIEINDDDPHTYNELATNYENIRQYHMAIQNFYRSIELGMDDAYTYAHIGSSYGKLKKYDKAIENLSIACDKNPGYIWALEELTYHLRQKGDLLKQKNRSLKYKEYYYKAIKYLRKAIFLRPNDSWLFNEMGYAYENLGEYVPQEINKEEFELIILDDNKNKDFILDYYEIGNDKYFLKKDIKPGVKTKLGIVFKNKRFKIAIHYYKKSRIIKENDYSLAHTGFCLRNLRQTSRAIPFFIKAIKLNPTYFWAISELAYCYELQEDFYRALNMYFRALALKPNDPYSCAHIGFIYLERARRKTKKKRNRNYELNKSIYFLKRAVDIDPTYVWALSEIGYALRLAKRYREAIVYLEKATAINQRDEWLFNEIGYCYEQSGDFRKAAENFIKVIELDMNNSYAYAHLGFVNRQINNVNKAILYLIKATRLNPNYNWAVTELGICLREKRWHKTALGIYAKSINVQGNDTWLLNDIGYCHEQLGEYDEAERFYLRSTELNVKDMYSDEYPIAHLGSINIMRGNYQEAEYYLKKALTKNPAYTWAHTKLVEVYERKNNYSGSYEFIDSLLKIKPQSKDLILRKAFFLRKSGEYIQALELLSKLNNISSLFEQAVNLWLLKRVEESNEKLNEIVLLEKKYARDVRFWEKKALFLLKSDETIMFALTIIERALEIEPADYSLNVTKGDVLMSLGKNKSAIRFYEKSINLNEENYNANEKLANAYLEIGESGKALQYAEKAVSLNRNLSFTHSTYAKVLLSMDEKNEKIMFHLKRSLALDRFNKDANFLIAEKLFSLEFYEKAYKHINTFLSVVYKGKDFLKGIKLKTEIKKCLLLQ